jgi:hypothetical protein
MAQPHLTIEKGVYTRSVAKIPFLIISIIGMSSIFLGIYLFVKTEYGILGLTTPTIFGLILVAAATTKLVIDTNSKTITESYFLNLIKKKKNGKLYNQYHITDNYINGHHTGKGIYLVNNEDLSIKLSLFGPFKNEVEFEKFEKITLEILNKLRA